VGIGPGDAARGTPAIPLGKAAAGRGAKENYLHEITSGARRIRGPRSVPRALKGRDVGGDFHRHGNDFGFGLGPGHFELRCV